MVIEDASDPDAAVTVEAVAARKTYSRVTGARCAPTIEEASAAGPIADVLAECPRGKRWDNWENSETDYNLKIGNLRLGPSDGFKVTTFSAALETCHKLHLEVFQEGRPLADYSECLWTSLTDSPASHGYRALYQHLWQAIAELLNTGLSLMDIADHVHQIAVSPIGDASMSWRREGFQFAGVVCESVEPAVEQYFFSFNAGEQTLVWSVDLYVEVHNTKELLQEELADDAFDGDNYQTDL